MASGGISNLVAAQLSAAAYTPLSSYAAGTGPSLPSGWVASTSLSYSNGNNQFITFVNVTTNQVVVAFKGSDNLSNFQSDATDSGYSEWASVRSAAESALQSIDGLFPGAQVMSDGHSLGGGMAQTFALENNLSGYGQNSLPITSGAIANDGISNVNSAIANWSKTNSFTEVNNAGDPATLDYQIVGGQVYLNTSATTTTLSNPYVSGEIAGVLMSLTGVLAPEGAAPPCQYDVRHRPSRV